MKTFLAVLALLLISTAVTADEGDLYFGGESSSGGSMQIQEFGDRSYFQSDDGTTGTSQTFDNREYIQTSDGDSAVCSTFGSRTYCN
jgi:hypothetical protein